MTPTPSAVEVLSLRRVAARFIAKNEQDGLDILDGVTSAVFARIRSRYRLWLFAAFAATLVFVSAIVAAVVVAIADPVYGDLLIVAVPVLLLVYFLVLSSWRWVQYRSIIGLAPQLAVYANADITTAKNLDRFFGIMQRETTPQSFWRTQSGHRRDVNRRQFFGSLRVLMLSEHDWVREPVFSPKGMRFARELFIEADIATLIVQAQAKPKAGGRPKVYDEAAMLLAVIEHPALAAIAPGKHGAESQTMNLIRDACQADRDGTSDIAVPEVTQLRARAKQVLGAIEKNRLRQK